MSDSFSLEGRGPGGEDYDEDPDTDDSETRDQNRFFPHFHKLKHSEKMIFYIK